MLPQQEDRFRNLWVPKQFMSAEFLQAGNTNGERKPSGADSELMTDSTPSLVDGFPACTVLN